MANLSQTFKVAGITVHGDMIKVRFTDDLVRRIKQFTKGGATRIDLIELPSAMTKVDALKYLATHADFQSPGDQATITDALSDREPKAPKVKAVKPAKVAKEPKVKAVKAVKPAATPKVKAKKEKEVSVVVAAPSLAAIKARAKKEALAKADAEAAAETPEAAE